jgi:hypothetical protein
MTNEREGNATKATAAIWRNFLMRSLNAEVRHRRARLYEVSSVITGTVTRLQSSSTWRNRRLYEVSSVITGTVSARERVSVSGNAKAEL